MNSLKIIGSMGIALLVIGCAQERTSPDEADAWEVPADNGAVTARDSNSEEGANSEVNSETPETLPEGVVAIVRGSSFLIDGTTETRKNAGDSLSVHRYFVASAPVELKTSVTLMETDLVGQNADGAVPLISMLLSSTTGRYRIFSQPNPRPIEGKQILTDAYDIGPGSYKITIQYFKDTVGQKRPLVTLNSVTFRNLPTSNDEGTPPANVEEIPPANAGDTLPANAGETPPADDEGTPPAEAGETPSADDLSGQSNYYFESSFDGAPA